MSERAKPEQPQQLSQEKATQQLPQDPTKLIGVVSHDQLCNTVTEKILNADDTAAVAELDILSITEAGGVAPKQQK
ncbi:hypothetical protein QJS10_CPB21g01001 [Acorus calamus]|uniref:Uncharacterized protein n=1 Tax=Acorus calamus TaxID=4465 RepID=A0AAV9C4J3_ACOCL|nr:hypothetical protein QJS10_CPB21g01001 [Acorus calamus]